MLNEGMNAPVQTLKDMSIEAAAYAIFNLQEYICRGEFISRLNGPLAVPHMLIAQ